MTPAERLASAEAEFIEAEHAVEMMIGALYDVYEDFEANADELNVYGVVPSPAAADAIHRALGFRVVIQHEHKKNEFRSCGCRRSGA